MDTIPGKDLDTRLMLIDKDADVLKMPKMQNDLNLPKLILYIEHLVDIPDNPLSQNEPPPLS